MTTSHRILHTTNRGMVIHGYYFNIFASVRTIFQIIPKQQNKTPKNEPTAKCKGFTSPPNPSSFS